jgi:uncharacterized protein YqeY
MQQKIDADIKTALMGGDKQTVEALRFLKSTLINAKISAGHDLNDSETIKVIRKEIKSRQEAKELYAANQRPELADKEEFEANLYSKYVPQEMSQQKVLEIIESTASTQDGPSDFAHLMPEVMKAIAGGADGKLVADTLKEYLNGKET